MKGGNKKEKMTQPKQKIRYKNVVLSVFENTTTNNETYESVSIQKFYYDQNEQQWKHTTNFNENDLFKVEVVINSYYYNKTE